MVLLILICVLLVLGAAYLLGIRGRVGHPGLEALRGWSYAHRGLHGKGKPENSMAAFQAAKEAGYGIELDVHLLADGNLAVIHDSALERVTGLPGTIEELTTRQLRDCKLCGTEEIIPELAHVLEMWEGGAPLIVELKPAKGNHAELAEAVCDLLERYQGPYCLESFDPRCILWLKKNRPELIRGQLSEDYFAKGRPKIPFILKWIMTENLANFVTKPDFVAYRYADRFCTLSNFFCLRRMACISWTVTSQAEYNKAVREGWIPIFEGFLPDPEGLKATGSKKS
jgi:glycerophosphoryl diester phosphodiesterase